MFEGLRAKLHRIQEGLSQSIESASDKESVPPAEHQAEKEKGVTIIGKVKVLINQFIMGASGGSDTDCRIIAHWYMRLFDLKQ